MAFGEQDLGIFFSDFGDLVEYGDQTTTGNLDAPGKDAMFGETSVSSDDYTLEYPACEIRPSPKPKQRIAVNGEQYAVQSASLVDEGAVMRLKLRKL